MSRRGRRKFVFIVGLGRSGGSLLNRLFDGHTKVLAYPFEPRFGAGNNVAPLRPGGSLAETLRREGRYRNIERLATRQKLGQTPWLQLDSQRFLTELESTSANTIEEFLTGIAAAFHSACPQMHNSWNDVDVVVSHDSLGHFGATEAILAGTPDTYIIHVLRHPAGRYRSLRTLRRNWDIFPEQEAALFAHAVAIAVAQQNAFPGRCFWIRYEDLTSVTEATLRPICAALRLEWQDILLRPTSLGREWLSNSSFERRRGIIPAQSASAPSDLAEMLERVAKPFLDIAGYSADGEMADTIGNIDGFPAAEFAAALRPGCIAYNRARGLPAKEIGKHLLRRLGRRLRWPGKHLNQHLGW